MKSFIAILLALLSVNAYAQCEQAFFSFGEGTTLQYTSYDQKGREETKQVTKILRVEGSKATVHTEMYEKDGDKIFDNEYTVLCEGDYVKIDFRQFALGNLNERNTRDMEVDVKGEFMELPNNLSPGQVLPEARATITFKIQGAPMTMTQEMIVKRTVEAKETITTPAGTFETYRIAETTTTSMGRMGSGPTFTSNSKSWIARGIGVVKNEAYNKKGKVIGTLVLTSYTR
jgi:hypothetical protein